MKILKNYNKKRISGRGSLQLCVRQIRALEESVEASAAPEPRAARAARAYGALQYDFPLVVLEDLAALEQELREEPQLIKTRSARWRTLCTSEGATQLPRRALSAHSFVGLDRRETWTIRDQPSWQFCSPDHAASFRSEPPLAAWQVPPVRTAAGRRVRPSQPGCFEQSARQSADGTHSIVPQLGRPIVLLGVRVGFWRFEAVWPPALP